MLVLKVVNNDFTTHDDFQWPNEVGATVEAPDWEASTECGNGLHGWAYGHGDGGVAAIRDDSHWMVLEVDDDKVVDLGGQVKFPSATIRFIGTMADAAAYLFVQQKKALLATSTTATM